MSSHDELPIDISKLTRQGMLDVINHLIRGKRRESDLDRETEEQEKKSALHRSHKGHGGAPPVSKDDIPPFSDDDGDEEGEDTNGDGDGHCSKGKCPPFRKARK